MGYYLTLYCYRTGDCVPKVKIKSIYVGEHYDDYVLWYWYILIFVNPGVELLTNYTGSVAGLMVKAKETQQTKLN